MSYKNLLFPFFLLIGIFAFYLGSAKDEEPRVKSITPLLKPLLVVGAIADADRILTVQAVADLHDRDFKDVGAVPTFGFSTARHWIRLRVFNFESRKVEKILEVNNPILNQCNLYEVKGDKAILLYKSGDDYPFAKRPVEHLNYQFPLELQADGFRDFILEVASNGEQLQVPLKLWSTTDISLRDETDRLLRGTYFGIILFVLLLNFFLYMIIREKSSLYYVIYVFSLFMLQFSLGGFAFRYLWPESSYLANVANPFFASLSILALIRFTQLFLNLKEFYPRLNKFYYLIGALVTVNIVISLIYTPLTFQISVLGINSLALVLNILIIPTVVLVMRKDFKPARFFLYAFIALVTSVFFFILNNFGVFRSDFYAAYGLQIGSAIEVILLSFAIVDKFKRFRDESISRLLTINDMKVQANEVLEKKVVERTEEITTAKQVVEKQKEEIVDSIRYAERIQKSLLPGEALINSMFAENFILFKPRDIVSGDFYWFGETTQTNPWNGKSGLRLFAAVDCTGHGVPGALMSILGYNGLEQCIHASDVNSPADALKHINNEIIRILQHDNAEVKDGMDMVLCAYDPESRKLHFAGSKNNLYIFRDNTYTEIKGDRISIGTSLLDSTKSFTDHIIDILPNDRLYTFTDGYPDQFGGANNKKLKSRQLLDIIANFADMSMPEQKMLLTRTFELWRGENEQIDDVCLVGIRF